MHNIIRVLLKTGNRLRFDEVTIVKWDTVYEGRSKVRRLTQLTRRADNVLVIRNFCFS